MINWIDHKNSPFWVAQGYKDVWIEELIPACDESLVKSPTYILHTGPTADTATYVLASLDVAKEQAELIEMELVLDESTMAGRALALRRDTEERKRALWRAHNLRTQRHERKVAIACCAIGIASILVILALL